jgi:hypothetical protein
LHTGSALAWRAPFTKNAPVMTAPVAVVFVLDAVLVVSNFITDVDPCLKVNAAA